jgi:iron complex outermembrane receptor protein
MNRRLLLQIPPLCAALTGLSAAAAADNSAAEAPPLVQLQEVVVTATKQANAVDVSKVPISISAYTRRDLEAQGANSIDQIAAMTPGVHFTQENQYGGSAQTNIEIRGIQSRTGAPTTGIYYDDTPILVSANEFNNGATLLYPVVFDMQRVEVLRGPQGTLFGNSAEGGAVRFIPTPPSLTRYSTSAVASLAGTRYGDASYEAGVAEGGPILDDRLGFRASAYYRRDGGWIDRCEPLVGQAGCGPILGHDVNAQETEAFRLAATWAPTDSVRVTPDLYYQRLHYNDGGGYEIADSDPSSGHYAFALSLPIPATDQMLIPNLKIEDALGNDVSMTSITSYVWQNQNYWNSYTEYQDFAFFGTPYPLTPTDYAQADYITERNDLYEELRFASSQPTDRVTWVGGVFLQDARQVDHSRVVHPDLPQLILQNYGQTIEQVLGVGPYLGTYVYWADSPTNDKQVAVFGNADVKLTRTLKLNLGLRYAHFKTDSTLFLAGPFNGGNFSFAGGASSNAVTPKVGFTWQPNASSLYYVSAGKGYRAGGVNDQTTSLIPTCHVAAPVDIKPDSLWSYELGAKNFFFDRRVAVDASAYYVVWNDIQNFTDIPQCGIGATLNLGDVLSKGFDVSMEALLTQSLKADLDVAYTDAYFKNTVVVPTGGIGQIVTAGDRVAGASDTSGPPVPPWSISLSGEYDFHPLGKDLYLSLQDLYDSRNNGPFFTHDPANAELYDPSLPTEPSTNMLNLRLGWRMQNGWDLKLFANNALNAHPQLAVNHALPSDPRLSASTFRPLTIGISGTYNP